MSERKTGRRGIHTIFDLRARCDVVGDHWYWTGCVIRGRPSAHAARTTVHGARITAIALGRDGEREPHQRWFMACGDRLCLSPKCLRLGTHAMAHAIASKSGRLTRDLSVIARQTAIRRRQPDVRPEWMVQWAIESQQRNVDAAWGLGVHRSTVGNWRHGKDARTPLVFRQLLRAA